MTTTNNPAPSPRGSEGRPLTAAERKARLTKDVPLPHLGPWLASEYLPLLKLRIENVEARVKDRLSGPRKMLREFFAGTGDLYADDYLLVMRELGIHRELAIALFTPIPVKMSSEWAAEKRARNAKKKRATGA